MHLGLSTRVSAYRRGPHLEKRSNVLKYVRRRRADAVRVAGETPALPGMRRCYCDKNDSPMESPSFQPDGARSAHSDNSNLKEDATICQTRRGRIV